MFPMVVPAKECSLGDVGCALGETAKNVASAAASGGLDQLKDAVLEAWGKAIAWLGTFWVGVDTTPVVQPGTVARQTDAVWWAENQLWWYTLALVVFGILVGCGRLVWEQRTKHLTDIVRQLITFTLVTGAGVAVLQALVSSFDELSKSLIDNATQGTGFATSVAGMISLGGPLGVLLIIIFGLIAILVSLLQLVMMVFRSGILILLAGALPTSAAFTNTETGKQWFGRFVSWTIAAVLYKPAAALCYAVAFKLTAQGSNVFASADEGVKAIVGLSLMVLALVALPALMRLVAPMVAAASGGGGGAAALGGAIGSLATGAIGSGRQGGGRGNSTPSSTSTTNTNSRADRTPTGASASPKSPAPTGAAAKGAGASGAAAGAGAGASGAAAAAGPAGMAAAAGATAVQKGASAVKGAAESATGEGPSGSQKGQ
ncbi:hypothetical protein [Sinomonas albida]|uniref:hypothetical protein n=1 Tax=Sinomonas albida TaxID=369942 RepID=UPI0030195ED2